MTPTKRETSALSNLTPKWRKLPACETRSFQLAKPEPSSLRNPYVQLAMSGKQDAYPTIETSRVWQREQRFDFHDRIIVGEGVNRLDQHRSLARLDVDVAERTERHPAAGIKGVQQAFGGLFRKLLLHHEEHVGRDRFQLEMGSIADTGMEIGLVGPAALERVADQAAFGGQGLMGAGRDFTDGHRRFAGRVPGDHVPAIGNIDLRVIRTSLNAAGAMNPVQLGVERPAENVKRKFGDFGANREHWRNSGIDE